MATAPSSNTTTAAAPLADPNDATSSATVRHALESFPMLKTVEVIKVGTTRRMMKLDPETKMTSADAAALLAKTTEMFMMGFLKACEHRAKDKAGGKAHIKYKDVARVVAGDKHLEFLQDLLPQIEGNEDGTDGPAKKKAKKAGPPTHALAAGSGGKKEKV